jgi:amino acid adenylation domain-containing protein
VTIHNTFSCFLIGEGSLLIQCAEILLHSRHKIYGVISSDGSVHSWARERNIPGIGPTDDLLPFLSQRPFEYLFSIVNNYIIPQVILALPRKYAINYHDAPLPKYAGSFATAWAIMHRETVHAVTWHVMNARVDAGDILKQWSVDIADGETALTLNAKCYEAARRSFAALIDDLSSGRTSVRRQDLHQRTFFPRHKKPAAGGVLSWNREAHELDAFVRGLDFGPYTNPLGLPKLAIEGSYVLVSEIHVLESMSTTPPGTITAIQDNALTVSTGSHEIVLRKVLTLEGRSLSISDFVTRFGLREGYCFRDIDQERARRLTVYSALVDKDETFWVKTLKMLQPLECPYVDRHALHTREAQYASHPMPIPEEVTFLLTAHFPVWRITDFLVAAYVAYLARIGGVRCFDLGFRDGELQRDLVGLEGFFASSVPLRVEVDYTQSFTEMFPTVQEQIALVKRHKTYARDVVARYPDLRAVPELLRDPKFPVSVELVEKLDSHEVLRESAVTLVIPTQGTACLWVYNAAVLDSESIASMRTTFTHFLRGIAADPTRRIAALPLLTAEERHQLLVAWNDTQTNYPLERALHQIFEAQVEHTPDAPAVLCEDEQLTYRELNTRANQLAHHLQRLGVGPEVRVGLCVERSVEMVIGLLGILKAGGAYVPLDPAYPPERLAFMLADAQVAVLVTERRFREEFAEHRGTVVCLDADWAAIAFESGANVVSTVTAHNLAYVIYTSGSTGRPKGVEIQHASVVNLVTWHGHVYDVTPADRATQLAGLAFDASVWELWPYLAAGASVHLADHATRTSPHQLVAWLSARGITLCFLPTPLAETVIDTPWPADISLRVLLTGGDRLHRGPRPTLPFALTNHYGPTEYTVVTTWALVAAGMASDAAPPIGRPIANTQVYVLDSHLQPVPIGVPGELHIGGVGLARGYHNRPELTAERFVPHPFSDQPGARLYRSGDLVRYQADGQLEFLGRLDHQVKVRGFRLELGEVEAVLRQHPAVREAVVMAREDVPGNPCLVAYVVAQQPGPSNSELRRWLQARLPTYMVPAAFVPLEQLPLTPNGKVDRRTLPAPAHTRPPLEDAYTAPRTPVEEVLAGLWADLLKLTQVGIHDNFFELGGHSLLATQLISRLQATFQVEVPLRRLFEAPTVAALAQVIIAHEAKPGQTETIARLLKRIEAMPAADRTNLLQRTRTERGYR